MSEDYCPRLLHNLHTRCDSIRGVFWNDCHICNLCIQ